MTIEKKYNHLEVEKDRYETWLKAGYFKSGDTQKPPYTIVIPPPNVTGKLHLGHAWDNTLQDIIIRQKRMQGYDALYLPGMDHAGIATQAKIDQKLKEQGTSRHALGRERFLEEAWAWKEEYAGFIREQWAALGLSVDYDKERFTLDEGLSEAVSEVFIRLYEKGLIYRKERIINWDVEAKTALSNIEVDYLEIEGAFYHFKYVLEDGSDSIVIATTRPETMFADTALMLHPDDHERAHFLGKKVRIPNTNVTIPVIADDYVDRDFGTGAVKVTPAHDPNDFIIGERHHLPMPSCMNEDGSMNALAFQYEGMDRFACRKALIKDLEACGLLVKIEQIKHNVGHSERTGVIVEPRLSMQWFVAMEPLAQRALKESTAAFVPARFDKIFNHWMENIQDWCISRQLWWGHRIPAYYKGEDVYVGTNPPEGYVQDEDVLDTWFSSALWPFSTLGWPHQTDDLKRYYPTQTMVTGYDIIFFWVARMIFSALEFTDQTPFENILIHGLIRDDKGRKMSKSLGNGVDPMDIKAQYGIDTLRYFLTTNSAPGQDLRFEMEKIESSWNFINKLWNIGRYVLLNVEGLTSPALPSRPSVEGAWILSRLNQTIQDVNRAYEAFEFAEAAHALYAFTWEDFASWYVEVSKLSLQDPTRKEGTQAVMLHVFTNILKLLHPFMPFVTEHLYQTLPYQESASIMISAWPEVDATLISKEADKAFGTLQDLITQVRHTRNTYGVKPSMPLPMNLEVSDSQLHFFQDHTPLLRHFLKAQSLSLQTSYQASEDEIVLIGEGFKCAIPLGSLIDIEAEKTRLSQRIKELENEIDRAEKMLANPNFTAKAPVEKVQAEQTKLKSYQEQYRAVKSEYESLIKHV